jgi:hypothetical protein
MLFNGSFPGEYDARVEEAFAATSLTCRKRIVAGNLRRDHRVPEPRAKKFIAEAEAFLTAYPSKDFEAAHGNYRETWNSYRPLLKTPPEYLLGVNSDNMPAPDPGSPLMHVLDLSKCHEEVSQGRDLLNGDPPVHDPDADDWRGILQDVPDGFREYSRWLGQRLRAPEKSVVVKALLAAHARYTMENGSVPVWATTETAFMRFPTDGCRRSEWRRGRATG